MLMKKVFGIIMLMFMFVGVTISAPTLEVEGIQVEFVISQEVVTDVLAVETPIFGEVEGIQVEFVISQEVVTDVLAVETPIFGEVDGKVPLSYENGITISISEDLNEYVETNTIETEVVATPLLDAFGYTNLENALENVNTGFIETEVVTTPLIDAFEHTNLEILLKSKKAEEVNLKTTNVDTTTNLKEVLFEFI